MFLDVYILLFKERLLWETINSDRSEWHEFGSRFVCVVGKQRVQKMRKQVTNKMSLYKLTNVFFIIYLF